MALYLSVTSRCFVKTDERIELVFGVSFRPPILDSVKRKFGHLQKYGYFPQELCPKLQT